MNLLSLFFLFITIQLLRVQRGSCKVGIDYGLVGDNLPAPDRVISFLKTTSIRKLRIYDPNPDVLAALGGSGMQVIVGVRNQDIELFASSQSEAAAWVTNLVQIAPNVDLSCISVGNEVIPGALAPSVLPAMRNLDAALKEANVHVPVSTVVSMAVMQSTYPPSSGSFEVSVETIMSQIVGFLSQSGYPFLINVYPYFAYAANPADIGLDYALFTSTNPPVHDGSLQYQNLFDAMVDSVHYAIEMAGGNNVRLIVTETGWPSDGNGDLTTTQNAQTYNQNLINHVVSGQGTPKNPGEQMEVYIFAMFNEDQKPAGVEQHWGLFYPDMSEVYHVDLGSTPPALPTQPSVPKPPAVPTPTFSCPSSGSKAGCPCSNVTSPTAPPSDIVDPSNASF